jgi:hypothetical protein
MEETDIIRVEIEYPVFRKIVIKGIYEAAKSC